MKITTKIGDKGETTLFGGRRVSKASCFIELAGELDELQAVIGWCHAAAGKLSPVKEASKLLNKIMDDLYRMMSIVGFDMKCPKNIQPIGEKDVEFLEKEMKKYESALENLNKFVRLCGPEISARLNIARTVCRRVERRFVKFLTDDRVAKIEVADNILKYLNRLSDLLFTLACALSCFYRQNRLP